MKESYIVRSKRITHFTLISNTVFNDKRLSLRAVGLLCYLLHLPDDWRIIRKELHTHFKDGRDGTAKAFNELIDASYIIEEKQRYKGKFVNNAYYVYESPQTANQDTVHEPQTEKPYTVKPEPEKPYPVDPSILNTNTTNNPINQELTDKCSVNSNELTGDDYFDFEIMESKDQKQKAPRVAPGPPSNHKLLMEIYYKWYQQNNNNVPPKIDVIGGKAMKDIVKYLEGVARLKLGELKIEATPENISEKVCEILSYILANWYRLEPFLQKQVKLQQISSNLTNIINNLKNGRTAQTAQQQKADRAGTIAEGFAAIDAAFGK